MVRRRLAWNGLRNTLPRDSLTWNALRRRRTGAGRRPRARRPFTRRPFTRPGRFGAAALRRVGAGCCRWCCRRAGRRRVFCIGRRGGGWPAGRCLIALGRRRCRLARRALAKCGRRGVPLHGLGCRALAERRRLSLAGLCWPRCGGMRGVRRRFAPRLGDGRGRGMRGRGMRGLRGGGRRPRRSSGRGWPCRCLSGWRHARRALAPGAFGPGLGYLPPGWGGLRHWAGEGRIGEHQHREDCSCQKAKFDEFHVCIPNRAKPWRSPGLQGEVCKLNAG